jgi:hypothetical protein
MMKKVNAGPDNLDFKGRQRLIRLLIEKVTYDGQQIEIQTIIPLDKQLCPVYGGGLRGRDFLLDKYTPQRVK